jgi:hypothetical protein
MANQTVIDQRNFLPTLIGDGRPLLFLAGLALCLSGSFAIFIALTGYFLPHDTAYLGMSAAELCVHHDCRIVHFMAHDRVAFGGALLATGILYLWLVAFPLAQWAAWAWWTLLFSAGAGFLSFLSYVGYGYLDTWHGIATLSLLGCFVLGLVWSWPHLQPNRSPTVLWRGMAHLRGRRVKVGRLILGLTAMGLVGGGLVILGVGSTTVFVPQDLTYMNATVVELHHLSPRLIPLIAHDRAGFGGAVLATGLAMLGILWHARPARHLWQALLLSGGSGFGCAVGVHFAVAYTDWGHLLPGYLGIAAFATGLVLVEMDND